MLDFDSFALRLPRAKLPRLAEELRAVPPERVAALQAGGRRVWERFTFSSLGLAEKRQLAEEASAESPPPSSSAPDSSRKALDEVAQQREQAQASHDEL